jgi:hypothetical protein
MFCFVSGFKLFEAQKHLRLATDQIQGLRERMHALEDEHYRLKEDYGRLCDQVSGFCFEVNKHEVMPLIC